MKKAYSAPRYLALLLIWAPLFVLAQSPDRIFPVSPAADYLPPATYNALPTPEAFLGYRIGDWHITPDQIQAYSQAIALASPRVSLEVIGHSHEDRRLHNLYISSPANLARLDQIRSAYTLLSDPATADQVDIRTLPAIIYQGYSIHGNESSGSNAAMLMLYYLSAGTSADVQNILDHCIIILDPCMNPDGLNRFAAWVNSHKAQHLNGDPNHREYNEPWPRGRTNHYWFDLNRDWLLLTQPESRARVRQFHKYKPLVLTDHHEMGKHTTFFYQPGVPSRTNPNTPARNQDITESIGHYHAHALDSVGSDHFSKQRFDDYYYGKGSTYPDANGTIGILFEQASSRGHMQETQRGMLNFPFTIRNQVVASLSTIRATLDMREELLEYRRWFYQEAQREAQASDWAGYVFQSGDEAMVQTFLEVLDQHDVKYASLSTPYYDTDKLYQAGQSYYVPLDQRQYKLVKTIFETVHSFRDSIFYDVSAWTMPLAMDLDYAAVPKANKTSIQTQAAARPVRYESVYRPMGTYVIPWGQVNAAPVLQHFLDLGYRIDYLDQSASIGGVDYEGGSYIVKDVDTEHWPERSVKAQLVQSKDLPSSGLRRVQAPRVAIIGGKGCSYLDVGEMWHHMDVRLGMAVSVVDVVDLNSTILKRYNTIVMAHSSPTFSEGLWAALREWVEQGGKIIATKRSLNHLSDHELLDVLFRVPSFAMPSNADKQLRGSRVVGGAIMEGRLDLLHPLAYGYADDRLPTFKKGDCMVVADEDKMEVVLKYTASPRLSGYLPRGLEREMAGSAGVLVQRRGAGRIVGMLDSPVFRAYWYGGNRMLANALYFL